jgi:hypothetical protein
MRSTVSLFTAAVLTAGALTAGALTAAPPAAAASTAVPTGAADTVVIAVQSPDQEPEEGGQPAFPDAPDAHEGDKPIVFPLDLDTPYGIFGMFLILSAVAAGVLGLVNAVKNLRGERDQADGSWRPR